MELGIEQEEITQPAKEVVNILNRNYQVHWTEIKKLPNILDEGLYSPAFARRIRDVEYEERGSSSDEKFVHLTYPPYLMHGHKVKDAVGIIVEAPVNVEKNKITKFRISPRQFVGLVVADELPSRTYNSALNEIVETVNITKPLVLRRVQNIRKIAEQTISETRHLPIYGISGDLYWPKRMSHDEIVEMLKNKQDTI